MSDLWVLPDGTPLTSRMLLGSSLYPSLEDMVTSIKASQSEVITVSLRRQSTGTGSSNAFWDALRDLPVKWLPNTAGCHSAEEAITTAQMAREVFNANWIKLEVIGNSHTLQPDPFELVKAAQVLIQEGFEVFPYCTEDLILCEKLIDVGCNILMPWGAPIGTAKGLINPYGLQQLRHHFPKTPIIIDAGLGVPSHAAQAMELGMDGILLNSAVAKANRPEQMAKAFALATRAGREAYLAGRMPEQEMASASTPNIDRPFWHQEPSL